MSISDRVEELGKKYGNLPEIMSERIDPPVYSHPELVYGMACDLFTLMEDLTDLGIQLRKTLKQIVTSVEELLALPVGSLILELESEPEKFAFPWVKVAADDGTLMWSAPGDEEDYSEGQVGLPAYVMWTPPQ